MKLRKIHALLNALLLFGFSVFAQPPQRVTITVTDSANNSALDNTTIKLIELNKQFLTNETGYASFKVKPGNYTVLLSSVGYATKQMLLQVPDTASIALNVKMSIADSTLSNVTVTGLRKEDAEARAIKRNVMPVTIITAKQIENRASDLNEILARQAGIQIRQSGGLGSTSTINVRGLEGKRVQIFIDGHPLNTPDGSLGINDLPLQIIERIEIYKGTVPAYLGGDGLGSAVNIIIRHRDVSYIDASASYQTYNTKRTGLILKKTWSKQGIEFSAGIFDSRSDNNYTMLSPYQTGLKIKRDHDYYHSLLAGGSLRFHKWWFDEVELEGAYLKNDKQIQGIQKNIQQAQSNGDAGVVALNLTKNSFAKNKLGLRYSAVLARFNVKFIDTSSYSYEFDGSKLPSLYGKGELGVGPNLSTNLQKEIRQRFNLNYKINEVFNLNLNNTFRHGTLDPKDDLGNEYAGKNLFNYPGNLTNSITGLTLETRFKDDKLLLSIAAKHYYNIAKGFNTNIYVNGTPDKVDNRTNTFGYNAGLRYNITNAFFVKASHERGVRLPNNTELFGDGILITPALFLQPEVAYNNTVGVVYDKTDKTFKRIQIETNVFYMEAQQLIQLSGNGLSLGYVNYAKARIIGADLDVKADISATLFASFNATYQKLTDRNKYIPATQNVDNPTYKLTIPNTSQFFLNWNGEFHKDGWIGKETKTRIIYDGSYVRQYNYGFNISVYDDFFIPGYLIHTLSVEQSFKNNRYTITGEANNFTNQIVLNNYNQPLPGRTFRIKFRYLLLGKNIQKSKR